MSLSNQAYSKLQVIEHTNNVMQQELDEGIQGLQVVSVVTVPTVGSTQTVETSTLDGQESCSPPLSPQATCEIILPNDELVASSTGCGAKEVSVGELLTDSQPGSPKLVGFAFASSLDQIDEQSLPVVSVASASIQEFKASSSSGQFITASPPRPFSPDDVDTDGQQRLPSVLEAAIKAEPKVEVERYVCELPFVSGLCHKASLAFT